MHKLAPVLILAFLLISLLAAAHDASARPLPAETTLKNSATKQETNFNKAKMGRDESVLAADEDPCEVGISEDECLLRRSLVAHLDYIYTQKNNKP